MNIEWIRNQEEIERVQIRLSIRINKLENEFQIFGISNRKYAEVNLGRFIKFNIITIKLEKTKNWWDQEVKAFIEKLKKEIKQIQSLIKVQPIHQDDFVYEKKEVLYYTMTLRYYSIALLSDSDTAKASL